jgi:hypothetical protein
VHCDAEQAGIRDHHAEARAVDRVAWIALGERRLQAGQQA